MAISARVYRPFDAAFSKVSLAAAERAWAWVWKNPDVAFRNPKGILTGDYGDEQCGDERLWGGG